MLFFVSEIVLQILLPDEFKTLRKQVIGATSFTSNFIFWAGGGYFDAAAITKPRLHLWSLAIEEQFYIFWPLIMVMIFKSKRNNFLPIIALCILSFGFNFIALINHKETDAFY